MQEVLSLKTIKRILYWNFSELLESHIQEITFPVLGKLFILITGEMNELEFNITF